MIGITEIRSRATPKAALDRVTARYHAAVQDYAANKATYLATTAANKAKAVAKVARRNTAVRKPGKK